VTAPHDGARGDIRKRHDAPRCLVCGNSVAVDASALAAAKAEAWDEGAAQASPYGGGYLRALYACNPYRGHIYPQAVTS
jgi:hypothetical protein